MIDGFEFGKIKDVKPNNLLIQNSPIEDISIRIENDTLSINVATSPICNDSLVFNAKQHTFSVGYPLVL